MRQNYLGSPRWSQCSHNFLKRGWLRVRVRDVTMGAEVRERECDDAMLLALTVKEGITSQEMWNSLRKREMVKGILHWSLQEECSSVNTWILVS